jgi:signal peptidase I
MLSFRRRDRSRALKKRLASILLAVLLALLLRALVIQAYRIPSGSMEDTLLSGDYLMAAKLPYGVREPFRGRTVIPAMRHPARGEVLVFRYPLDGRDFIKRCAAVSGDTVAVRGGELYINSIKEDLPQAGHKAPETVEPWTGRERQWSPDDQKAWEERRFLQLDWVRDDFGPVVVPGGCLFMMGDNRDNSMDSRFWGPLPESEVRGRALFIYWSWDREEAGPPWRFWKRLRWGRLGKQIR